ncbi:MAG: hypothetical protein LRY73_05575 [Bacillus sp. (in: Bacteria)]|nr:hypothetical protein [Bacillus sp. (in: firmicutes)]
MKKILRYLFVLFASLVLLAACNQSNVSEDLGEDIDQNETEETTGGEDATEEKDDTTEESGSDTDGDGGEDSDKTTDPDTEENDDKDKGANTAPAPDKSKSPETPATNNGKSEPKDTPDNEPSYVLENDAFKIITPKPNDEIENEVVVRGLARVYEGTIQYELEDGHYILASGFTTASSGAPGWGEFEITINVDFISSSTATLILYEESAKDGSRLHELVIPLKNAKDDYWSGGDSDGDGQTVVAENSVFEIYEPAPHSEVENQVVVRGLARVYEGTVLYELEDGHHILANGFTTASTGAPDWGEFEVIINFDQVANNTATLILFTESAKDGSRMHELMIPLTVKK